MPGFGTTERGNHMPGLCEGIAHRERAKKRVLTREMGSAHILCPCSYTGTSQVCVIATAQSVGHFVACVSRGVKREISMALAVGFCWRCSCAHIEAVGSL